VTARQREAVEAIRRGWHLLRLRGKRPLESGWPTRAALTEREAVEWAAHDNLGVNCGASGLVVVDVDLAKGARWDRDVDTACCRTGSGGLHLFYRAPATPLGCTQGRLGVAIDTRGVGGQVVLAGSSHPSSGKYRWEFTPEQIGVRAVPDDIVSLLRVTRIESPRDALDPRSADRFFNATLRRLMNAREGSRGWELNRAAFIAGGLVAAGVVPEAEAIALLLAAAGSNRLSQKDGYARVCQIIECGLRAGKAAPIRIAS
jgi:hypothetical protein